MRAKNLNTVCPIVGNHFGTNLAFVLKLLLANGSLYRRIPRFLLSPEGVTIQIGHDLWMCLRF